MKADIDLKTLPDSQLIDISSKCLDIVMARTQRRLANLRLNADRYEADPAIEEEFNKSWAADITGNNKRVIPIKQGANNDH